MPDLLDGESVEVQGSARLPYVLKNIGGVYSCSCPAWRNQSLGIERRTCKHLRQLRGDEAEQARVGASLPAKPLAPLISKPIAPPLLLAHTWDQVTDVTGFWVSEKLDGVRAYWDGKRLVSRNGHVWHAPDWFLEPLPNVPLDGELWLGHKEFQRTVSIVRRHDKSDDWRKIQFVVFDAPAATGGFEERMQFLQNCFRNRSAKHVGPLEQRRCRGVNHLREQLACVEAYRGEGLMLRQPGSRYEVGRSATLLKVKSAHEAEAVVVGYQPGAGRHRGRLGALHVELPDGTKFSVGTGFTDAQRKTPPAIGATITFRYQELTDGGVPRFPSFVRVRTDVAVAV